MSKLEKEFWEDENILKDLLFNTNLSYNEIAKELNLTHKELNESISKLGLGWLKKSDKRRKMSRGQTSLTAIMQELFPKETIVNEFHIGEGLRLDVYCPVYQVAAEYHGRQHFVYTDMFHGSKEEFTASKNRDKRKEELCYENGIALVVYRYTDSLTKEDVVDRIKDAMRRTPYKKLEKSVSGSVDYNNYMDKQKRRSRDLRKKRYRQYKDWVKSQKEVNDQ